MNKPALKGSRDIEYLAQLRAQYRRINTVLYTCQACKYTFPEGLLNQDEMQNGFCRCPDCGKFAVRLASSQEIAWYQQRHTDKDEEDESQQD